MVMSDFILKVKILSIHACAVKICNASLIYGGIVFLDHDFRILQEIVVEEDDGAHAQ